MQRAADVDARAPFTFSDEHELFRDSVRGFARSKLADGYLERATSDAFPEDAFALLAGQGLVGMTAPEHVGGQAADPMSYGIAVEELAWADFNLAEMVFSSSLLVLLLTGSQAAEDAAAAVVAGTRQIALALTEPGAGSDAASLSTRALPVEGGWRLYGEKTSITAAPHADCAVAFATTPAGGSTAFLVDLDDSVGRQRFKDPGNRPIGRGSLTFEGTFVPRENRLSPEGRGFHDAMRLFDLSRPVIALMACGVAQRAIDMTVAYVKERVAFGRPVSQFQGVSFVLAENDTRIELARSLAYRTLGLRMAGLPHTRQAAMLKWWGPASAYQAIHECVILHGHVGWSEELPLQQMLRDVSGMEIGDGTPQIQKLVVARELLGRAFTG
jgi:cyclohexanecarboxyl-CoA dehydrogenase